MTNPTSNFGWQMPTNTDLVTDLPADFEVFGQAVDTSMADLKGGTTGQILSKATNTDMDFVWIANDQGDITGITATSPLTGGGTSGAVTVGIQSASTSQSGAVQLSDSTSTTSSVLAATPTAVKSAYDLANTANTAAGTAQTTANTANTTANAAIPKSTVTAKGSIVAATASSTPANLAVGNNGETLVADSSTSTGLRYTAGNPIANPVINSCYDIWQRGTSVSIPASSTAVYAADRWSINTNANQAFTFSRQTTSDTTNLPFIQYCGRIQRNSGQTGTATMAVATSLETTNSIPFVGKTVTMSFYARAGANYSAASSALAVYLQTGTGTDQNVLSGFTGQAQAINQTATLTTTWQRFSYSATLATSVTQLAPTFGFTPVGTAGVNDYFEVTGMQIDIGSVALPIRRTGSTFQGELAAAQRYFYKTYNQADAPGVSTSVSGIDYMGASDGGGNAIQSLRFPVAMRTNPTVTGYRQDGTANQWGYSRSGASANTAFTCDTQGQNGIRFYLPIGANWTVSQLYGHITASAEL